MYLRPASGAGVIQQWGWGGSGPLWAGANGIFDSQGTYNALGSWKYPDDEYMPEFIYGEQATADGGDDVIPPTPNITVNPNRTKISRVAGVDASTFTWQPDEALQEYQIRIVSNASDTIDIAGALIESGGSVSAAQDVVTEITDDELVAASPADGPKIIKVFGRDLAGNWSL